MERSDLVKIVNALRLVDEATIVANEHGILVQEMEPAKVAMVVVDIHKSAFEMYNCDKPTQFKVAMSDLKKITKLGKDCNIRLLLDERQNRLHAQIIDKIKTKYVIPLLDFEPIKRETPTIIFKAKIKTLPEVLQEIVTNAKGVGDYLEVQIDRDMVLFKTSSLDREMEHELDSDIILEKCVEEPVKSVYPLVYLQEMVGKFADFVTLELSTNMPMRITYDDDDARYIYYIAPRREQ